MTTGFWRTGLLTGSGIAHLILPAFTLGMYQLAVLLRLTRAGMWWLILFPGAALFLLVIGINLFADWLREELNPKIER